jgi:hypothetical protein
MEGIAKAKSSSRIPIRFWSQEAPTHLPWAREVPFQKLSVAAKKGTKMAVKWSPARGAVRSEPFPLLRSVVRNGPEPSRARRCWARRSEPLTARTVLR